MNVTRSLIPAARRAAESAFTMIEIAFSLAVIGLALVAILGVLPIGLEAQRNNRRETIINQDANYLIEAIRGGGRGIDDLTNYVLAITNYWTGYNADGTSNKVSDLDWYTYQDSRVTSVKAGGSPYDPGYWRLTNGLRIIGILSTPKFVPTNTALAASGFRSNYVVAYLQAISGGAAEKYPQTNEIVRDTAFSYRMVVDLAPYRAGFDSKQAGDPGTSGGGFYYPDWTNYMAAAGAAYASAATNAVYQWLQGGMTNVLTNYTGSALSTNADFLQSVNYWLLSRQASPNLYDLRILFRFPVLPGGRVGNGRQTYRAMLSGRMLTGTNEIDPDSPLFFLSSQNYTNNRSLP